ncbi:MAG: hypothetical protein RIQ79_239 [Verrucomicrobiota bacterium]
MRGGKAGVIGTVRVGWHGPRTADAVTKDDETRWLERILYDFSLPTQRGILEPSTQRPSTRMRLW